MSEIWSIILAAGESTRMKTPKMLLPFNGLTIIEKVIENVGKSVVDKTILVLGANREKILKVTGHLQVKHCYNENYKQGMLSSVICGFRALPDDYRAVLVILGDQPFIGAEIINSVIDAYNRSGKGILMPVFGSKRGHPLLIDRKYRNEIEKLDPGEGLRSLYRKFTDDVFEVKTENQLILKDIDTEEDYINSIKPIN
ncbi:MAG: nucleotidyltransferase family protein [Bacteroidales bacterium]|nr:nucleotidyltransferase family protein [Bacteroidales bacterium]